MTKDLSSRSSESGDSALGDSLESLPPVIFTPSHLAHINARLNSCTPQQILEWAIITIPNLYQTTAFGLTGLATIDMLSKLPITQENPVPLIFIDTLHHFQETLDLVDRVRAKYPNVPLHVYTPENTPTADAFTALHGPKLWERDEPLYDYLVKVEPARRAYADLNVRAVLTGRRRSQGADRSSLPIIELDETGLIKINPLASASFADVKAYIDDNGVPYNALLDQGYKSVGDWHSTVVPKEGESERAGRWAGKEKTECGLHADYFKMKAEAKRKLLEAQAAKAAAEGVQA